MQPYLEVVKEFKPSVVSHEGQFPATNHSPTCIVYIQGEINEEMMYSIIGTCTQRC